MECTLIINPVFPNFQAHQKRVQRYALLLLLHVMPSMFFVAFCFNQYWTMVIGDACNYNS